MFVAIVISQQIKCTPKSGEFMDIGTILKYAKMDVASFEQTRIAGDYNVFKC